MDNSLNAPVLLIAFNRPDTTKVVFDSISKVKPKKLFVAVDGPRNHKQGEAELCKQVIEITKNVDWECETKYLIREKNLGCKLGVTGAISWALETEDRVIIIEDDIVLKHSFFKFADDLLEKYQFHEEVAMISASNFTPFKCDYDYFFSLHGHIGGGWATWKRVWDKFNVEIPELEEAINFGLRKIKFSSEKEKIFYIKYFENILTNIKRKTENAWGPQFLFFRFQNNLLSIVPRVNMSTNIGFYSARSDEKASKSKEAFWYPDFNLEILIRPNEIVRNIEYDKYHFKNLIILKIPLLKRAFNKISRIIKSL